MSNRTPRRLTKQARLAAALKELGHAVLDLYPDAERAVLVVTRPDPYADLHLPVVVPEAGVPEPEGYDPGFGDRPAGRPNGKGE